MEIAFSSFLCPNFFASLKGIDDLLMNPI